MTSPTEKGALRRGTVMAVLGVLVALVGLFAFVQVWRGGIHLKTRFPTADGLNTGAEVRVSGVKVGDVRSIHLLDPTSTGQPQVEVELVLTRSFNGRDVTAFVHQDAHAYLRSEGSLSLRFIDIVPGTPSVPFIRDGDTIAGTVEPSLLTLDARGQQISRTMTVAQQQFDAIGQRMRQGHGTVGAILYKPDFRRNLTNLLRDIDDFSRLIEAGNSNIARLRGKDFARRLDRMQNHIEKVRDAVSNRSGATKIATDPDFQARLDHLVASFQRLGERVERLQKLYSSGNGSLAKFVRDDAFRQQVRDTRETLRRITTGIDRGDGTAGKLLHDPRLRDNFADLTAEITKTAYDMRQKPFRYFRISFGLF